MAHEINPGGQKVEAEVVSVNTQVLPQLWPDLVRGIFHRNGGAAVELPILYGRLLLGEDVLWLALYNRSCHPSPYAGVLITSITEKPPMRGKSLPPPGRSLTVHIATGSSIESWIDSAIERISSYGHANGCRQIYVLARKGWRPYALRFYGQFDVMGYSRDRSTAKGRNRFQNRPGLFRKVELLLERKGSSSADYGSARTAYILPKGESDAAGR
ncbi:MAG TPA: hypothetical protein VKB77_11320 [Terriglobales bacterium]|nr:hypothetical protein [Terriglobales bacterium]